MSLTIGIDPRIRARRIAVRRAEGRRRLRVLLVALAVVGLAVGAWGLTRSPLLDLDHVRIDGIEGAQAEQVVTTAGLTTGAPLLDVDLGDVDAAVTALPWVSEARVTRDWPGTVRIAVEAREPLALLQGAEGTQLVVDAAGVVLGPAPSGASLPVIALTTSVTPGGVEPAAAAPLVVATELTPDLAPWVEALTVTADADGTPRVGLDLVGEAVVDLGTTEQLPDKLQAVRSLLDRADLTCVRVIDVVVADLATIRRDPDCAGG